MGKRQVRIPENLPQASGHFVREGTRIMEHFPCFHCELRRNRLVCLGSIRPSEDCDTYRVQIDYVKGGVPQVRIRDPIIEPNIQYHTYPDGQLCLFDHRMSPWEWRCKVHETIIPWIAEWLVFYELWKVTGKWLGPAAPHGEGAKVPQVADGASR